MIHFFSNHKIIFVVTNIIFIVFYLFPGSLAGFLVFNDFSKQPQITPDFFEISSNHFYAFFLISIIGILTFYNSPKLIYFVILLIFYSIILELLHMIIPNRTFQYEDLFGNLYGVITSIFLLFIKKVYEKFK
jgi:hypothetical protein